MDVQLEWWALDEGDGWETIVRLERWRPPWPAIRAGAIVLALIVGIAAGMYTFLRWRSGPALEQITFQIQSVMDLEAHALDECRPDLYMAQQDRTEPEWAALQAEHFRALCAAVKREPNPVYYHQVLSMHAQAERVEMRSGVAWVEAVGPDATRQARFYRQTELGWLHTMPQAAFWGDPITVQYPGVVVRGHERDLAYAERLARYVRTARQRVCETLGCTPQGLLTVDLVSFVRGKALPSPTPAGMSMPSLWLSGVPDEKAWDQVRLAALDYGIAYAQASRMIASGERRGLGPLQHALCAEFATLYSRQDTDRSPLLRRVVEQHGTKALARVWQMLPNMRGPSTFLTQWFEITPALDLQAQLQIRLKVEREALLVGQRDTYLLFQSQDRHQLQACRSFFDQVQGSDLLYRFAEPTVRAVHVEDDLVRVTYQVMADETEMGQTWSFVSFYRWDGSDWKKHGSIERWKPDAGQMPRFADSVGWPAPAGLY